jgi:hypothetical protein
LQLLPELLLRVRDGHMSQATNSYTAPSKLRELLENIIQVRAGVLGGFPMMYDKADEMARLAAEALLIVDELSEPLDRGEAVNLARNIRGRDACVVTDKGIDTLAEAVLRMDEELRSHGGSSWTPCSYRCAHLDEVERRIDAHDELQRFKGWVEKRRAKVRALPLPRNECPGCFSSIYDGAAAQGWCCNCFDPVKNQPRY